MKINFSNTERPLVYQLNLETVYSASSFINELDQENWQVEEFKKIGWKSGGGRHTIDGINRYNSKSTVPSIKGEILKQLVVYSLSDEFKARWLTKMLEDSTFCMIWGRSNLKQMMDFTTLQADYALDNSMTTIALHLDNRLLLGTGMIYLNETNDLTASQQSTIFYTDQERSNPLVIKPSFGSGWAAANTHNSWHEGKNLSIQKRYSLLLGLAIDVSKIRTAS
jgi:hypothetical protein